MLKILKYSLFDLTRSRWTYGYFLFYLVFTFGLLYFSNDLSKAIISMMNIILVLNPLIATLFGALYFYNSREFAELLLALPLKRSSIFIGKYFGTFFVVIAELPSWNRYSVFNLWYSGNRTSLELFVADSSRTFPDLYFHRNFLSDFNPV